MEFEISFIALVRGLGPSVVGLFMDFCHVNHAFQGHQHIYYPWEEDMEC